MEIKAETLDDLLMKTLQILLEKGQNIKASRGENIEQISVNLELENPLSRISRSYRKTFLFSALGEFLWYMSGSNDLSQISYYIPIYEEESEDGLTLSGAYGPILFQFDSQINQIENVIKILQEKSSSRRAVVQLINPLDLHNNLKDIPCTCNIQYLIRDNKLHSITYMRSNDAYKGLPHDFFCFTMLQEYIAARLNVELGTYFHHVGSLHLYNCDRYKANQYIDEGFQSTTDIMPLMDSVQIDNNLTSLLNNEKSYRRGKLDETVKIESTYWSDLSLLLEAYMHYKNNDIENLKSIKQKLSSEFYYSYIDLKIDSISESD